MFVNILQVPRLGSASISKGFDCIKMSACAHSNLPNSEHRYVIVEQRPKYYDPGCHYYLCKSCGHEKSLENACVIEMDHQHDYRNYRGCINGFYIIRCTHYGCDSFLRIFNPESQACTNEGKHHLEE
jgi:hypothetical protein